MTHILSICSGMTYPSSHPIADALTQAAQTHIIISSILERLAWPLNTAYMGMHACCKASDCVSMSCLDKRAALLRRSCEIVAVIIEGKAHFGSGSGLA